MEKLKVHIGKRIKEYVKENRVSQASLSRKHAISQKSLWQYMKNQNMRTDTLFSVCQMLEYNFLREIADRLPASFPPHTPNPLEQRVKELEKENEMLKHEIEIWKKVAGVRKD
jgi:transcriptional regulator with XRE-family HTH domain